MSDGSEGQPGDAQPPGLANDDYEPPVRPRRTGLRIVAVVVLASFLLATLFGYGSIIWDAHRSYFWPRSEYSSQYPGDTERIGRTWTLDNSKNEIEALEEAQAIALDPKASKEEQSTAEAEVAFSAWDLGETDVASSAIADFDKDSPGLNLDPVVVNQEKWTEYYLKGNIAAKRV